MPYRTVPSGQGLRVVHTIDSLRRSAGGPTRTVTSLCRELGRLGVQVDLVSRGAPTRGADEDLLPPPEWVKTCLVPAPSASLLPTLTTPMFRTALRERCEQEPRPVIHNHGLWLPTNHTSAAVAREFGLPLIISARGMLEPWALNYRAWKKRLAWHLYQRHDLCSARLFHATAHQEGESLRQLGLRQPIALIPNGVDLPELSDPSTIIDQGALTSETTSQTRTALFLGRIHPKKGLLELVDAWSIVRPNGWRMVIAGPEEVGYRAAVEARLRAKGLSEQFEFVGSVDGFRKTALYRSADLFVLPTYSENFGVVVAEALICGLPVITTKGAPWQDLETHRCGWWVDLGIDPLVAALREAMWTPASVLHEMGERGRVFAEGAFGWPGIAQEMLAVYRWILGQGERPECVRMD